MTLSPRITQHTQRRRSVLIFSHFYWFICWTDSFLLRLIEANRPQSSDVRQFDGESHRRRDGPISGRNRVLKKNENEKKDGTWFHLRLWVEHKNVGVLIWLCRRVSPEIKSDRLLLIPEHAELVTAPRLLGVTLRTRSERRTVDRERKWTWNETQPLVMSVV